MDWLTAYEWLIIGEFIEQGSCFRLWSHTVQMARPRTRREVILSQGVNWRHAGVLGGACSLALAVDTLHMDVLGGRVGHRVA